MHSAHAAIPDRSADFPRRTLFVPLWLMLSACLNAAELPPGIRVDTEATAFFERTNGWVAGDGAISIPLSVNSKRQILWLFGDSHLDDLDPRNGTVACLFQCRNAGLLQTDNAFTRADTLSAPGPTFRSWFRQGTNDDQWLWPLCGFQEKENVFVYLAALRKTGAGGQWGFESTGQDFFARFPVASPTKIEYLPLPKLGGISFGQGFVREGDLLYAFGSKGHGLGSDVFVARFSALDPATGWRFWDGKAWNSDVARLSIIGRGTSTSIHVCKVRDRFVVTTSAFSLACDQGKAIYTSTSASPTGPFPEPRKLCDIPDQYRNHTPFFYFPILHPEFINSQNEILLTYSINNYEPCVPACVDGRAIANHYRPKALRVKLPLVLGTGQAKKREHP